MHPAEQKILQQLSDLSSKASGTFWVAYSGGLDSQVLLELARKSIPLERLHAIHINHGLSPHADMWQSHCQEYCDQANISLQCQKLTLPVAAGNIEKMARQARYEIFEELMQPQDYCLMAHHQDDQLETILYRLLRGSGPRGLAGIPQERQLGRGKLYRPLLHSSKQALFDYATQESLTWIEDDSNQNTDFDRNFLRHNIIPGIRSRWPEAASSIQRSADLSFEGEELLSELAQVDIAGRIVAGQTSLPLDFMRSLDPRRQRNVLRYWFRMLAQEYAIPTPGYEELRRMVEEAIPAAEGAQPLISWKHDGIEVQLRRYADKLFVLKNLPQHVDRSARLIRPGEQYQLDAGLGTITVKEVTNGGFLFREGDELEIRLGCDLPELKPFGRRTRSIKKIYQDYAVPPWLRDRIPMVYVNGNLAAVADLFVCHKMAAKNQQKQLAIHWQRADIYCGY